MVAAGRITRDWRVYAGAGAVLILLLAAAGANGQNGQQHPNPAAGQTKDHPLYIAPTTSPPAPGPYVQAYSCSKPNSAVQENLCIERTAAKAARDQAHAAWATFGIGVIGTIGVLATLGATAWAAWAAHRSAAAALATAKSSEIQAGFLSRQTEIIEKQQEIARLQYYAEHRPRLVVRDVYFTERNSVEGITFEISNNGGSPLVIKEALVRMWFMSPADVRSFKFVGGENPGQLPMDTYIGQPLANGITWVIQQAVPDAVARRLRDPNDSSVLTLCIFGMFIYTDERGDPNAVTREAIFRRRWNSATVRFERTGNPDHEYSD